MLQPIDISQPLYIPTRTSPNVVSSSRKLVPLGIVEMGSIQYYKFNTGSEPFTAHKFYPVTIIQEINPMAENEVTETVAQDTVPVAGVDAVGSVISQLDDHQYFADLDDHGYNCRCVITYVGHDDFYWSSQPHIKTTRPQALMAALQEMKSMIEDEFVEELIVALGENQMAENEVTETVAQDTVPVAGVDAVVDVAPVVETDDNEVGAKIVSWNTANFTTKRRAEKEIAELVARGWVFQGMAGAGGGDEVMGEYSVLYVRPSQAVK